VGDMSLVLVVAAGHSGHHLGLGLGILNGSWHHGEDREPRRELGQLCGHRGCACDVNAAAHSLRGLHDVGHGGGGRHGPRRVVLGRRTQREGLHHFGVVEGTDNLRVGERLGDLGVEKVVLGGGGGDPQLLGGQGTLLGDHVEELVGLVPEHTVATHLHIVVWLLLELHLLDGRNVASDPVALHVLY